MAQVSSLEYALVGLLKQKAQSGYDLRKAFTTTPIRHFSDSPGSIYPALRRLQAREWLRTSEVRDSRRRQLFRVTRKGNAAFVAWLKQPVTREEVIWRLDELSFRFAFQGGNVPRAVSVEFLNDLERELVAYVAELRAYAKQTKLSNSLSTGALAFASGIEGYQAHLDWSRRARKKIMEAS